MPTWSALSGYLTSPKYKSGLACTRWHWNKTQYEVESSPPPHTTLSSVVALTQHTHCQQGYIYISGIHVLGRILPFRIMYYMVLYPILMWGFFMTDFTYLCLFYSKCVEFECRIKYSIKFNMVTIQHFLVVSCQTILMHTVYVKLLSDCFYVKKDGSQLKNVCYMPMQVSKFVFYFDYIAEK